MLDRKNPSKVAEGAYEIDSTVGSDLITIRVTLDETKEDCLREGRGMSLSSSNEHA